jgi:NAD(P)-dependent dehydrogenase (short-subunit alcohol dehydrogenase family)
MAEQRTILIAGASRGIGRATALALAAPGVSLILAARSAEALEAVAMQARAKGATALEVPCNLTVEPHVRQLVELATEGTGRIDLAVHSVGGALVAPLAEIDLATWEESLRAQLSSLFLVAKHGTARMEMGGLFVGISSVAARQVFPGWAAYCAAKAGGLAMLNALREELRPRGIRVTAVLPAATDTELWARVPGEWNRAAMLRPDEVAAAVASLAAYPAHVTVEELTVGHVAGRL